MINIKENQILSSILSGPYELPNRTNHPFETDVEILELELPKGEKLALTVDVIAEEIEYGLYTDPYLIGWMSVIISLSDLAAAGAVPLGLLSILNVNRNLSKPFIGSICKGQQEAAQKANVPLLGGDTNFTSQTQVGTVGIGKTDQSTYLSRIGMKKGDILFSTGPLGMGNGYAFQKLFMKKAEELPYFPQSRFSEAAIIKKYATASIDTSDGFFPAVGQLLALNPIGLQINTSWSEMVAPAVKQFNSEANIPLWFYLAGPHGEFEILFTVPESKKAAFQKEAHQQGWHPLQIGTITEDEGRCVYQNKPFPIEDIVNAFIDSDENPQRYFQHLQQLIKP